MNEYDRIQNNTKKLDELYPYFRTRIIEVINTMEHAGYHPRIQTAWRSLADQLEAYKNGTSQVQYGFHNVTSATGVKEALAVDILDNDNPTGPKLDYILHLAAAAEEQGLITGVRWGLADEDSVLIDIALKNQNWDAKIRVGWDPLHVEVTGMTIQEAKNGKRPDSSTTNPPVELEPTTVTRHYRVQDVDSNTTVDYDNWHTAFKPVTLIPVPYVSQLGPGADTHKNDCGAASAVMLLRAYTDTDMTPDQFYTDFSISGDPYLSVTTMRNAMAKMGLLTNFKAGLSMSDLFNTCATGKPLIVLIRYGTLEDAGLTEKHFEGPHFAVVVGMDTKYIYMHDPLYTNPSDGEAHPYPLDIFWKAWKDVALDSQFPNPERSAIIPAAGLGYSMQKPMVINTPSLNVRSGPGLNYNIVGSVKKGEIVNVIREVNGWGEINTDQWIYLSYTLPATPGNSFPKTVIINVSSLNVRSGPGTNNGVVGSVKKGETVKVTREVNGWGEINPNQWISLAYTLPAPQ